MFDTSNLTDKQQKELEKKINEEYRKASQDMAQRYADYVNGWNENVPDGKGGIKVVHHQGLNERYQQEFNAFMDGAYHDASGRYSDAEMFYRWLYSQEGRKDHLSDMEKQLAQRMVDANVICAGYINNELPKSYTSASNFVARIARESAMEQGKTGIKFDLIDEYAVKRLMVDRYSVSPVQIVSINTPRDYQWNAKKINNVILQGFLKGDDVATMAKNLMSVSNMNRASAMRNCRTAITRARNCGCQDRFDDLGNQGVLFMKMWIAHDVGARKEHAEADGQPVLYDDPFIVGGEEMMYPADASGSGWNVYNCRCSMGLTKPVFTSAKKEKEPSVVEDILEEQQDEKAKEKEIDEHYKVLFDRLEHIEQGGNLYFKEVQDHSRTLTEEEIINALAGGDMTRGSCASCGLAYIGQKQGWDVLDFRDGMSRTTFSSALNLYELSQVEGIKAIRVQGACSNTVGSRLLKQVEQGKEYYLCVGKHASIVRMNEDGKLQYLELQSATNSGWTDFNGNVKYTLHNRFGCTNTSDKGSQKYDFMIDIDASNFDTPEFKRLLGYINTSEGEQKKGAKGVIR